MPFIGTTAALALALLAQGRLAHGASPLEVGALFLAAAGLALRYFPRWEKEASSVIRAPSSGLGRPLSTGEESGQTVRGWPRHLSLNQMKVRGWLLVAAWLAQAGALVLAAGEKGWPWDGLLWGLSILAFLASLADRVWWKSLRFSSRSESLILATVLSLALLVRTIELGHLPAAIHGDEAQFGLNARTILRSEQQTLFSVGWYQFPIASFAVQAGVMRLFGDDIGGLRLSSALFGTLTLLPVYLLARSMFDRRVALASAAMMAVGHWPVHFSRLGINNIQATFFAAWTVYLMWRALRTRHQLDYALTGLSLGLGLYTYYAARLMPFVVGAMLALHRRRGQDYRQSPTRPSQPRSGLLALVIAGTLTIAPQVVYFVRHPEPLISRQRGVFLFNNLPHLESAYHTDDWSQILRQQLVRSLLVFNAYGDSSGQYGFDEPMLDWLTAGLMVVGLSVSLWRWRRGPHRMLHLWFWPYLLLGSVLTIDAPFVPRLVALMPVPFIWAGIAIGGWWRLAAQTGEGARQALKAGRVLLTSIPVVALLVLVSWTNYDAYINRYIRQRRAMLDSTEAAHLMADLPASTQVYLMGAHNIYAGFSTFRFVAPNAIVQDVINVTDWVPVRKPDPPDVLFLLWPSHMDRLPYLKGVYPDGDYRQHFDAHGNRIFVTYLVPNQAIRRRQGLALSSSHIGNAVNIVWQGTLWLPDDGPRQFCRNEPEDGVGATYLQIDEVRIDSAYASASCDGLTLTLNLPAGPHAVEVGAMVRGEAEEVKLYWRREGDAWEEVPRHLMWNEVWSGGLLGTFEREGTLLQQQIVPLIAYRDFARELTGPVQAAWTGCLTTDTPGQYEFRVRSFDGARLMVDGRALIQDDHQGALEEAVARVELATGRHPVRLEALFTHGPRWLEWYWRPPGGEGGWALVPPEVLTPGADCLLAE